MRTLEKNKQKFFFSLFVRKVPIVSEGLKTGEYEVVYTTPKSFMANISPAKGFAAMHQFGIDENYDKAIILSSSDLSGLQNSPNSFPIDEESVFWIDKFPYNQISLSTQIYDYKVKRISKSLNTAAIFISKVDMTEADPRYLRFDGSPEDSGAGVSGGAVPC